MREWDSIESREDIYFINENEREKNVALLVQSRMKVFDDLNVTMN